MFKCDNVLLLAAHTFLSCLCSLFGCCQVDFAASFLKKALMLGLVGLVPMFRRTSHNFKSKNLFQSSLKSLLNFFFVWTNMSLFIKEFPSYSSDNLSTKTKTWSFIYVKKHLSLNWYLLTDEVLSLPVFTGSFSKKVNPKIKRI